MSTVLILQAVQSARISSLLANFNEHDKAEYNLSVYELGRDYLLAGFAAPAAAYSYKLIESAMVEAYMQAHGGSSDSGVINADYLSSAFSAESVTYGAIKHSICHGLLFDLSSALEYQAAAIADPAMAAAICRYGVAISYYNYPATGYAYAQSSLGSNPPRLKLTVGADNNALTIKATTPAAGARLNRTQANVFAATTGASGLSAVTPETASGTLRWRVAGSGTVSELATTAGTAPKATIAADALPSGDIEYQFVLVSTSGNTVTSDWVSISTVDTLSTATADAPNGALVDGDSAVTLQWTHANASGTAQTQAELQAALSGQSFAALATVTGAGDSYTAPAGTFASGTWQWRVRTYNIDGAAGAWSESAQFMAVSTPSTPVLLIETDGPRPVITWQTSEQEGYELRVDGGAGVIHFGAGKRWRSPDYLKDGEHLIEVRVQNSYGLWSGWGGVYVQVAHTEGSAISLTVEGGASARLTWSATGYDWYIIYRDGVPIAKTVAAHYTDNLSAGETAYFVRGCYDAGDDYGRSAEIGTDVLPETIVVGAVSDLDTVGWLALELSDSQHRVTKTSRGRTVSTYQLAGCAYPGAEATEFCSRVISVSCAFEEAASCRRLEALTGRLVCLKTPEGDMATGYLESLTRQAELFYSGYSFSVQHLQREEAIDIDA